jgi:hypothetical protein
VHARWVLTLGADLTFDLRYFATKVMSQTKNTPVSDMHAYIRQLNEERGKIVVFRRDHPVCAHLLANG